MILRVWRGSCEAKNSDTYEQHLRMTVVPHLRNIEGFRRLELARRDRNGLMEFQVMTYWESMDAVRRFAGEHPERAVIEPGARAVLASFEDHVEHFEIVIEEDNSPAKLIPRRGI